MHSCQLKAGDLGDNSPGLTKIGQEKIGKMLPRLMSFNFYCNIRMESMALVAMVQAGHHVIITVYPSSDGSFEQDSPSYQCSNPLKLENYNKSSLLKWLLWDVLKEEIRITGCAVD